MPTFSRESCPLDEEVLVSRGDLVGTATRSLGVQGNPTHLIEVVDHLPHTIGEGVPPVFNRRWSLPSAGLYQLLAPMLDRLQRLPVPQRDAFGVSPGGPGAGSLCRRPGRPEPALRRGRRQPLAP